MKLRAALLPREGKYYGTRVSISLLPDSKDGTPVFCHEASIWMQAVGKDGEPSVRELNYYGYTRAQWERNTKVTDGFGQFRPIREVLDFDSHSENVLSLRVAEALVAAVNGKKLKKPRSGL